MEISMWGINQDSRVRGFKDSSFGLKTQLILNEEKVKINSSTVSSLKAGVAQS